MLETTPLENQEGLGKKEKRDITQKLIDLGLNLAAKRSTTTPIRQMQNKATNCRLKKLK